MAGFRTHITVSAATGVAYAGFVMKPLGYELETAILAGTLTTIGGMLPDLDSDSGVPVREMFSLASAVGPILLVPWLVQLGLTAEGVLASMIIAYVIIRYGLSRLFKWFSVHRGMYHSIPAMFIAGLIVFLGYHSPNMQHRVIFATGTMIGFLSHLILDEIYSVNFQGIRVKLKSSAGSALKLISPSLAGTATCYALLGCLIYLAYKDYQRSVPTMILPSGLAAKPTDSTPVGPLPKEPPLPKR